MIKLNYSIDNRATTRFFESLVELDRFVKTRNDAGFTVTVKEQRPATEDEYMEWQVEQARKATKALGEANQRNTPPAESSGTWRGTMQKTFTPLAKQ